MLKLKNNKKWFTKRKKENVRKLDIQKTIKQYDEEFDCYFPRPGLDLEEYKDDNGTVDIDEIAEEDLIAIVCKYIDNITFDSIVNPRQELKFDRSILDEKNLDPKEVQNMIFDTLEDQVKNSKTDSEIMAEVCYHGIVDPQFESVEQLQNVLPANWVSEIFDAIITFVDNPLIQGEISEADKTE